MIARQNPFASDHLEKLAFRFPDGDSWEALLSRLELNGYTGAIVGGHGSGKTTLIEQLASQLEQRGFRPEIIRLTGETGIKDKERLPERLRQIVPPGFVLLDGAEQLSTRQWLPIRSAAGSAAGFVVTLHRVSRLPIVFECDTDPELLEELVEELTGGTLPHGEAAALLARHDGNIRDALSELYDRWAGEESPTQESVEEPSEPLGSIASGHGDDDSSSLREMPSA